MNTEKRNNGEFNTDGDGQPMQWVGMDRAIHKLPNTFDARNNQSST